MDKQQPTTNPHPIYSLYIINKAGGLIYQSDFSKDSPKLTMNDHLRLGSTFHGLYAITANLKPTTKTSTGIEVLEADGFRLHGYQTPTGIKFYLTGHPQREDLDQLIQKIYAYYSDYVLKNPFYEVEQPIHCQQFDFVLENLLKR